MFIVFGESSSPISETKKTLLRRRNQRKTFTRSFPSSLKPSLRTKYERRSRNCKVGRYRHGGRTKGKEPYFQPEVQTNNSSKRKIETQNGGRTDFQSQTHTLKTKHSQL